MTKTLYHQIWQGDSRELCDRFKPGKVNCIVTDPPFGVDNLSNRSTTEHGKAHARKIANDESPEVARRVFQEVMDVLLPKTSDDCDMYVFTSVQVLSTWIDFLAELGAAHGFVSKAILVWDKERPGMGDLQSWGQGHEFILYLKKGRVPRYSRRRTGVIQVSPLAPRTLIHPHEKPEGLLEILLEHSTKPGDFVVDPFGGSGSLVRAARNIGRSAVAIEYDERNYREAQIKLAASEGALF